MFLCSFVCSLAKPKDKDKPLWYFTFCSQNCHDIYEITSSFENGNINADEAKLRLNNLNLSKLNIYSKY